MAAPTDPYNFTNGATADAEQVDARFAPLYSALAYGGLDAETLASQAWTAWTPTFTTIGGASNTIVARSIKLGRTVHMHLQVVFGSGGSLTGSDVTITAPYTAANTADQIGSVYAFESTGQLHGIGIVTIQKNTTTMRVRLANAPYAPTLAPLGATYPWTWDSGDILTLAMVYEAAS